MGLTYWADFQWNDKTNRFDVSAYGEEASVPEGFVRIESGTFTMGSPEDELGRRDEETQHQVTLTRDFYLAEMPVTQAQWAAEMGSSPSYHPECDDCPVEMVSWFEAVDYCNALSARDGLTPAYAVDGESVRWNQAVDGYRLPTEAEWEYACRAGTASAFYNGEITILSNYGICDELDENLDEIGWYCVNTGKTHTQNVGQKLPNPWGIYDMSGNVFEWCWDWKEAYPPGPAVDPTGPDSGVKRVKRGGSWNNHGYQCRSAFRAHTAPEDPKFTLGFRLARTVP